MNNILLYFDFLLRISFSSPYWPLHHHTTSGPPPNSQTRPPPVSSMVIGARDAHTIIKVISKFSQSKCFIHFYTQFQVCDLKNKNNNFDGYVRLKFCVCYDVAALRIYGCDIIQESGILLKLYPVFLISLYVGFMKLFTFLNFVGSVCYLNLCTRPEAVPTGQVL